MAIKKIVKNSLLNMGLPFEFFEEKRFLGRADREKLSSLKNKFKGKRCFIIGNGPSLNKIDLNLLKSEYTFGVNGIFYKTKEMGFKPTFYVVEDYHVMQDNVDEIVDFNCEYNFFPARYKKHFKGKMRDNNTFFHLNEGFYIEGGPNYEKPRFSYDASSRLYCGQSVTIVNLQMAYYLGFDEVYLIGMDFNYDLPSTAIVDGDVIESTEDDINHFHPDYFGVGKKWHDPKLHNVLKNYEMCKFAFEQDGREIINATVGGKLEVFNRVDFKDLFV